MAVSYFIDISMCISAAYVAVWGGGVSRYIIELCLQIQYYVGLILFIL